jgi:hypothetical protein
VDAVGAVAGACRAVVDASHDPSKSDCLRLDIRDADETGGSAMT